MKNRFFSILLLMGLLSCQPGTNSERQKEKLKNILSDYYNALAKKDLAAMKALTTADFVLFENGEVFNNESAVKYAAWMGKFSVQFKFDSLNTRFGKSEASTYYFREADFNIGDSSPISVRFLESATFEKRDDKWMLRFLHSSQRK